MTLKQISDTYGLPTSMIRKCFPAPQTIYYMDTNGNRRSSQVWPMRKVEKALKYQAITHYLEKKQREEEEAVLIDEISVLYEQYSPEMYVERAKKLKRTFILHVGPTNSGKTYDAIEDMKKNTPGTYLGPLRLLALEMYDKLNAAGVPCSMVTGEESLITEGADVISSTIELCNFRTHYKTAVIDEAQLIADPFRGSAWLKAICLVDADIVHICMAPEALSYIKKLIASFGSPCYTVNHERLSPLYFGGIINGYEDLRAGDALICFSRKSVLSTAALLEKNGFKASVIYGALPPEARRNEVKKFLDGDTNMVVATDAIGMGISLPIKRIIFTEIEKYDGGTQDRSCSYDVRIQNMPNTHQHEDDHLLADAFKANAAVQLPVLDSTHDAGDIIHRNKHDKGKEQAITSSEEVPQPSPDGCKNELNKVPELFHVAPPLHEKRHPGGCQ